MGFLEIKSPVLEYCFVMRGCIFGYIVIARFFSFKNSFIRGLRGEYMTHDGRQGRRAFTDIEFS
ncbi:hypothetical protein ACJX0J_018230, partial [Zea mays]